MSQKVTKAIIPAAGLGTRFLPATKALPKEMLPIVDKPTLQYIVEEAVASGIKDILIISGRSKRAIEDHFDKSYELESELLKAKKFELLEKIDGVADLANIFYVRQKEALGLGHAILCGKAFSDNEPFAVLLGDDVVYNKGGQKPCIRQLMDEYEKTGNTVLGVQQVATKDVSKYGIVSGKKVADRTYAVDELIEKPSIEEAPSNVAVLGRYVISPKIFDIIEKTAAGKGNEIQLTDALNTLAKEGGMTAYEFEGRRYDVGSKHGFIEANIEYALRDEELRDGITKFLKGLKL